MELFDEIRWNAQIGLGSCQACPAQKATGGEYVNPGLYNPDADVMFVTMDPSHDPYWNIHDSWESYNSECTERFKNWSGYDQLKKILQPLPDVTVEDIWLADSIKCPVDNSRRRVSEQEIAATFDHCRQYLRREIEEVSPEIIVTFGADAGERVLSEYFDIDENLSPGHADCGRTYEDIDPPVIVSPHWFHGWLGRSRNGTKNSHIVRDALYRIYTERSE